MSAVNPRLITKEGNDAVILRLIAKEAKDECRQNSHDYLRSDG